MQKNNHHIKGAGTPINNLCFSSKVGFLIKLYHEEFWNILFVFFAMDCKWSDSCFDVRKVHSFKLNPLLSAWTDITSNQFSEFHLKVFRNLLQMNLYENVSQTIEKRDLF